ncbi:MAG: squalene synthase HpnC [Magnetococcales bacterium]|nr:squalene synthase HpnC [Magnetococcales bacterium]
MMYLLSAIPSHLTADFDYCRDIVRKNTENFPVGSLLAPRQIRHHLHAVYAFARTADDFADLPGRENDTKLQLLDNWSDRLMLAEEGKPNHPVFRALRHTFDMTGLTSAPFHELLVAFRMDVTNKRYETLAELEEYCRYSANPVGRIILHIAGEAYLEPGEPLPQKIRYSDAICTALQLTNHLQDLGQDTLTGRPLYLPREELERFGVDEKMILIRRFSPPLGNLVKHLVEQSRQLFEYGSPLVKQLQWPLNLEMATIIEGGLAVLGKIEEMDGNTLRGRPRLTNSNRAACLWRAIKRIRS